MEGSALNKGNSYINDGYRVKGGVRMRMKMIKSWSIFSCDPCATGRVGKGKGSYISRGFFVSDTL